MSAISLHFAFETQKRLDDANISSVVTGVWGFNYHGVDIVMHDFELCVPSASIDQAAQTLQAYRDTYRRLPDIVDPDFYRCYRRGAKQFQIVSIQPPLLLYLVSDRMLGMTISESDMERGLTPETAHNELQEYCEGVPADAVSRIAWPSLARYLEGFLQLSIKAAGLDDQLVYLMYVERLIDANNIDQAWCDMNFKDEKVAQVAKKMLAGKENRMMQDKWE